MVRFAILLSLLPAVASAQPIDVNFPSGPEVAIPRAAPRIASRAKSTAPAPTKARKPTSEEVAAAKLVAALETVRTRYPNRKLKIEKQVLKDAKSNYVNHGTWKKWDEAGRLVGKGEFRLGAQHGKWTQTLYSETPGVDINGESLLAEDLGRFQRPFVNEAAFEDGQLVGKWSIVDATGRAICSMQFDRDKLHGAVTSWHANGEKHREFHFSGNLPSGRWAVWDESGKVASAVEFTAGYGVISHKTEHPTGGPAAEGGYLRRLDVVKITGDFWGALVHIELPGIDRDVKQGSWTTWYANGGTQSRGAYLGGQPVGLHQWWYDSGQPAARGSYVNGKRNGKWEAWHQNGMRRLEAHFDHGHQVGKWLFWNDSGNLIDERLGSGVFENGLPKP